MTEAGSRAKRGAANPHAKLTEETVAHIRTVAVKMQDAKRGWKAELAARYGISASALSDILSGRRWPEQ